MVPLCSWCHGQAQLSRKSCRRVGCYLGQDVHRAVLVLAASRGVTMGFLVRQAVHRMLLESTGPLR